MRIVTLITDFGLDDHYAGLFKGALLRQESALNMVDITHNVKKFDIVHAAFILRHTYKEFPLGTIHILHVMAYHEKASDWLALEKDGHFFLGPDNGIFSLAFREETASARRLGGAEGHVLSAKDIVAQAVARILSGVPFHKIGLDAGEMVRRISLQPVVNHGQLNASVIHVDGYGNAILNIDKTLFREVCGDRSFSLYFKRNDPVTSIRSSYSDVPIGDVVCLFNSSRHLEIAMNMDSVAEKYGLKVDDTIIIKLED